MTSLVILKMTHVEWVNRREICWQNTDIQRTFTDNSHLRTWMLC